MEVIAPKFREAEFFLDLLDALEKKDESISNLGDRAEEASFLLSAITNAFYAVLDQWKRAHPKQNQTHQKFKNAHPQIYGTSDMGGWRNTTVHKLHVQTSTAGYKPPRGDQVGLNFRETPKLIKYKDSESVALTFVPYFYFIFGDEEIHALEFCYQHLQVLKQFVNENSDY